MVEVTVGEGTGDRVVPVGGGPVGTGVCGATTRVYGPREGDPKSQTVHVGCEREGVEVSKSQINCG